MTDWEAVRKDGSRPEHQPGWVPDPEWDAKMEEKNESWCLEHDCWKTECGGLH